MRRVKVKRGFFKSVIHWFRTLKDDDCPNDVSKVEELFYIVGHRGACAYEVENTIPSFEKGIQLGANALEIDLSITKDGHVVAWHDFDPDDSVAIARQIGAEPIAKYNPSVPNIRNSKRLPVPELTLMELREHFGYECDGELALNAKIPTVDDIFEWANEKYELKLIIFDIKITEEYKHITKKMMDVIHDLMNKYNPHYDIVFMTPREVIIDEMRKHYPQANYTWDVELPMGMILDVTEHSAIEHAVLKHCTYASVGRAVVGQLAPWETYKEIIKYDVSNKEFIKLIGWTIKDTAEMECLIKMGVDGLVIDHPDKLKKVYEKLKEQKKSKFIEGEGNG